MELLKDQSSVQPQAAQIGQMVIEQVKSPEQTAQQKFADIKEAEFDKKSALIQAYVSRQLAARDNIGQEAQKELALAVRLIGDISTTDKPWIRKDLPLLGSIETVLKATLKRLV